MIQKDQVKKMGKNLSYSLKVSIDQIDRLYSHRENITPTIVVPTNIEISVKRKYRNTFKNEIILEEFFSNQKSMDADIQEIVNTHFEELL